MIVLFFFLQCANKGIYENRTSPFSSPCLPTPQVIRLFSPLLLSASAKLAIWLPNKGRANGAGSVEPVLVLEGLLKTQLRVEHGP